MSAVVPISVIIPTYQRGTRVINTIEKVLICDPIPEQIVVHVDQSDGRLEEQLTTRFPSIGIISSQTRLGPGGGRHRCLEHCVLPYAVSFDDDSYPVDKDFFERVIAIFQANTEVAILEATIWQRNESPVERNAILERMPSYTGCGYAIRVQGYRQIRGHIPRHVPYGMEELDVAIQLFEKQWQIYKSGELRVFHDTELKHHNNPEITAGTIANSALFTFLHYPVFMWWRGTLQLGNTIWYCVKKGMWNGILQGLAHIPTDILKHRQYRHPLPRKVIGEFLRMRRAK